MSNASQVQLSYQKEVTYGVDPAGTRKVQRFTSESLKRTQQFLKSREIDATRQIPAQTRVDVGAAGGVSGFLSYGAYDDWFEWLLQADATWSTETSLTDSATISANNTNHFLDSANGFTTITVGDWIRTTGWTNAANNGYWKVSVKTSDGDITVVGGTTVTEAAGAGTRDITVGQAITNGTTFASMVIEKKFSDITRFETLTGMSLDKATIALTPKKEITVDFSFVGKIDAAAGASAGSGYTAAPTNPIMNGVGNVTAIREANAAITLSELRLNLTNALRTRNVLGTLGPDSLGSGAFEAEGDFEGYYASDSLVSKSDADTETSLAFIVVDANSKGYVVDIPSVKLTETERLATGVDGDVMAKFKFAAFKNATEAKSCRIVRFP